MPLPKQVREDVLHLNAQSKHFQRLLDFWKKRCELIVQEILSPMTEFNEREVLVRFHDTFKREVIDLPIQAYKEEVKEKEQTKR